MTSQQVQANPYVAGSPLTRPDMFVGREDVFRFINDALVGKHQDNVIVLYGQRRTGKTSVLYQMHRHVDPRYMPILIDLQGLSLNSISEFFWEIASVIYRALRRDYRIELPRPRREEFADNPMQHFQAEFLEQVWSAVGDRHLLLMVDETTRLEEQIQAGKLDHQVFDHIRSLMQHNPRLNFIFSLGSRLEQMQSEYGLLFNIALYKEISFLDRPSAVALIRRPVESLYRYDDAAVDRILGITSGHPYYTQLLCHSLFTHWQRQGNLTVTVQDVESVLSEVMERATANLKFEWDESVPEERLVLVACAEAAGATNQPVDEEQVEKTLLTYNIPLPPGDMVRALKNLVARELLLGPEGYRFAVDILRMWVQQQKRMQWVMEEVRSFIESLPAPAPAAPAEAAPLPLRRRWVVAFALGTGVGLLAIAGVLLFLFLPQGRSRSSAPSTPVAPKAVPMQTLNKCYTVMVGANQASVNTCLLGISTLQGGGLRLDVAWTASIREKSLFGVAIGSTEKDPKMYITTANGSVVQYTDLGGAAKGLTLVRDGETRIGWFVFPPLPAETQAFTFVDDDQKVRIENIALERRR
ncbi:MAG: ATP-binding protein [Chloroflexi bacterium]|nr:ATP-binding protein [Chloroflexota bacterium]